MAHITLDQDRASLVSGLRGIFAGWRRDFERYRTFQRTLDELSSLTDRELSDIGVGRSQIVNIAWDASQRV